MVVDFDISTIEGFDWNKGNLLKNQEKHNVTKDECEEIFSNEPLRFFNDGVYFKEEKRYGVLGKTNQGRRLAIIFTIRSKKIRIISARDQGKKDRQIYEEVEKEWNKEVE